MTSIWASIQGFVFNYVKCKTNPFAIPVLANHEALIKTHWASIQALCFGSAEQFRVLAVSSPEAPLERSNTCSRTAVKSDSLGGW